MMLPPPLQDCTSFGGVSDSFSTPLGGMDTTGECESNEWRAKLERKDFRRVERGGGTPPGPAATPSRPNAKMKLK